MPWTSASTSTSWAWKLSVTFGIELVAAECVIWIEQAPFTSSPSHSMRVPRRVAARRIFHFLRLRSAIGGSPKITLVDARIVVWLAHGAVIERIPEQLLIALVGSDVIDDRRRGDPRRLLGLALHAQRVISEV